MTGSDIEGARYRPYQGTRTDLLFARERRETLIATGIRFPSCPPGQLPWLMALEPFTIDERLTKNLIALGQSVFLFIDAVQELYKQGHYTVRNYLDLGTNQRLCGLDIDRGIQTFRLDCVIEAGKPIITEIEEVYGNAGKTHAMQQAYGVTYNRFFKFFADLDLTHILVDDQVKTYDSELALLCNRLKDSYGQDVRVQFFSESRLRDVRHAWRFCYTRDLEQYTNDYQAEIISSGIDFCNPLFHGYGTKLLTALPHHPDVAADLEAKMGPELFATLREGLAGSSLLGTQDDLSMLVKSRKNLVVKVVDSPADRSMTWGSRGIYFGESSRAKWDSVIEAIGNGHLPGRQGTEARFACTRLVESDRFDVAFLHPDGFSLCLLQRSRLRLAPIFHRAAGSIWLAAGHATFVNTSRKVHLGRHAVCAPLKWREPSGAQNGVSVSVKG